MLYMPIYKYEYLNIFNFTKLISGLGMGFWGFGDAQYESIFGLQDSVKIKGSVSLH